MEPCCGRSAESLEQIEVSMIKQKTIKNIVELNGIGLHSGKTVNMKIMPAGADSGIRFRRTDVTPVVDIQLRADQIHDTMLATSIINPQGVRVSTIEHFLSAVSSMGLDNLWWSSMLQNFPFSMGVPEDS